MRTRPALRSNPSFWLAASPLMLKAGVARLELVAPDAIAGTHESTELFVPAGAPDKDMQVGAAFARELDPNVEISFWDSQSGSLSMSRVEGDRVKCIDIGEAFKLPGRFLNGCIEPRAQAMFALAHEVGHCKLRHAFLNRSDGRVAESNSYPSSAINQDRRIYGAVKKREFSWNLTI
jgi:hypothetical protein